MKLPAYTSYKPSGVEWIGDIPSEWMVRRLKECGRLVAGSGFPHEFQGVHGEELGFYKVGDLGASVNGKHLANAVHSVSRETALELRARVIPAGAVVYAKIGAALLLNRRRITVAPSCIDNNMTAFVARAGLISSAWAFYWTSILNFGEFANPGAVPSLSEGDQGTLPLVCPPLDEQIAICEFLDPATARVDMLLAKKRALVERLKEKRTALISRTVTRGLPPEAATQSGLDPNPNLKPSGIDWLGNVPEHWEIKRLRFISPHITVGIVVEPSKYYEDEGVPCLRSLNVRPNTLTDRDLVHISPQSNSILSKSIVRSGDLVAVRSGQPGTTAVVDDRYDGANCIDLIIIRRPRTGNSKYFSYLLNSHAARAQFASGSGGAIQQHFNIGTASDLLLVEPARAEQTAIANFLDRETANIDALVVKVETAIERLQEYRAALISAAVTGKIDVRGAAA